MAVGRRTQQAGKIQEEGCAHSCSNWSNWPPNGECNCPGWGCNPNTLMCKQISDLFQTTQDNLSESIDPNIFVEAIQDDQIEVDSFNQVHLSSELSKQRSELTKQRVSRNELNKQRELMSGRKNQMQIHPHDEYNLYWPEEYDTGMNTPRTKRIFGFDIDLKIKR